MMSVSWKRTTMLSHTRRRAKETFGRLAAPARSNCVRWSVDNGEPGHVAKSATFQASTKCSTWRMTSRVLKASATDDGISASGRMVAEGQDERHELHKHHSLYPVLPLGLIRSGNAVVRPWADHHSCLLPRSDSPSQR